MNRILCQWALSLSLALVLSNAVAATSSSGSPGRGGRGGIDELHLLTVPVALNLDREPGLDGFEVRVYGSSADKAKGLAITRGALEILMFDGVVKESGIGSATPLKIWIYAPSELKPFATTSTLGLGYRMALRWGTNTPSYASITVVARHLVPKMDPIYSSSSVVAVSTK